MKLAAGPANAGWLQLYGASILCGIGLTMSLFIGALAYPGNAALVDEAKIGTLAGSVLSAVAGFPVLRLAAGKDGPAEDEAEAGELFAGTHGHD